MLVTPLSAIARHRLTQHGALSRPDALRLSQLRSSTIELFPEIAEQDDAAAQPVWNTAGMNEPNIRVLRDAAARARALRPSANVSIDQCHADIDSLCRRVGAILLSRQITRTRVAFVGDDDLASVALLQIASPERVLLVDIDERIIATAVAAASELDRSERLSTARVDLSAATDLALMRTRYSEGFDVVVTDPPYAINGMLQFVEAAMAITAYGGEIHLAVPALLAEAWTDDVLLSVQALLVTSGFVIDRVVPGAYTYETRDVVSSLVVARRLHGGPPVGVHGSTQVDRFYTTRFVPAQEGLLSASQDEERQK